MGSWPVIALRSALAVVAAHYQIDAQVREALGALLEDPVGACPRSGHPLA